MFQKDWCHAGGKNSEHYNYGLPHVCGFVPYEDGTFVIAKNCVFCGKDFTAEFEGGMYGK